MENKQIVEALQAELAGLKKRHDAMELTVMVWNAERRRLDTLIRLEEQNMLALRVEAWRKFSDTGHQLEMF